MKKYGDFEALQHGRKEFIEVIENARDLAHIN